MTKIVKNILLAAVLCLPLATHGQTDCNITLPYSTGFETDVPNQTPSCWTALGGQAIVFNFDLYAHTGSQILALNCTSTEVKVATPRIPLPLNQIGVTLWYVDLAWTPGLMRVGFVTSLTGTVQWIDTIPTSANYDYIELDYTGLSITDTGYLVFAYNNTSGVGNGLIDDLTIYGMSDCGSVTDLRVREKSNSEATIAWSESVGTAVGCMCYISDTNSRQAAFDSVFVPSGMGEYTFTSLTGNRQYYVWVMNYCGDSYSTESSIGFVTDPDCGGVRNLQATSDYRVIGLSWEAPTAGDAATGYRVEHRLASASLWDTALTTNRYYFLTELAPDSLYYYRVTALCDDSTGMAVEGHATTLGCTTTVKDSTGTHGSLPIAYSSNNSYSQQIYLASEMTGIDTITGLTFWIAGSHNVDETPVVVYLGNTSKSQFGTGTDYVPVERLTQVFDGTISNTGREVTIRFDSLFVRMPDSNLVVALDNNLDGVASTLPAFVVGSASMRALYRTSIGNVNPASPGFGTRASYVNRIKFGTRGCELPQCNRPVVCVAEVGNDYVDVAWSGDSATEYACAYRLAGENTWTVADSAVTGNTYRYGNLDAGNGYELQVSYACGSDTLRGFGNVLLPCLPMAVPYSEDFESQLLNSRFHRACWETGSIATGYFTSYPTVVSLTGSTNKVCQITNGYFVLPRFDTPLNELQVRFDIRQTAVNNKLVLALLRDVDDTISRAIVIDTFAFNTGDSLMTVVDTSITYRLNHIEETEGNLVFLATYSSTNQYVDNIVVEAIPDCEPVTQGYVGDVSTTTATVYWTEPVAASSEVSYLVEYGPRLAVPGTGEMETTYGSSLALSGLNHSSDYDVYIYTLCNGDTSSMFGPIRFSTLCDVQNQLPYVMNFDSIQSIDFTEQTLPTCWYGAAPGNGTVPTIVNTSDTAQATSGTYCLQYHGAGIATLPLFGESLNDLKVQFHLSRDYPATSTLLIGTVDNVEEGFMSTFVPIDTVPYTTGINESQVTFYLTEYTGTATRLALRAIGPTYANQFVDDLMVDIISECIDPQHVSITARSATTATIAWRMSRATRYAVEYGPHGFTPGTGFVDTTASQHITLTSLLPATTYDIYVKGLCGTSTSGSTQFTFNTMRGLPVTDYPYHCSFADDMENNTWELDNGNQTNRWSIDTAAFWGNDDSLSLYVSNNEGSTHQYNRGQITHAYAYRAFEMTHTSYHIHYNWLAKGEGSYDFMRVFLVPAGTLFNPGYNPSGTTTTSSYFNTTPQGWIALDNGSGLSNVTEWQSFDSDFEIPEHGEYYLLFYWLNDGSGGAQPPAAVDNISVSLRGCPTVEGLTVERVTTSSITLEWTNNALAEKYIVEYGMNGFTPGSGNADTITGTSYTAGGLEPGVAYDFYLLTQCGENWYADSMAMALNVSTDELRYYTVTGMANNDEYGSVDGSGRYQEGEVATLQATPADSYHFEMWDNGEHSNPLLLTVTSDTTVVAVFAADSVGIDYPSTAQDIILYPNPTTNSVNIKCEQPGTKIVIHDMSGRERLSTTAIATITTLDLHNFTPGVYFVEVESSTWKAVQRLIIK